MAGINPNLPNLKLQNLQMNSTQKVDAKAPEKTTGDAKPAAVWLAGENGIHSGTGKVKIKKGDVIIGHDANGRTAYYRVTGVGGGSYDVVEIGRKTIESSDFENKRGNKQIDDYVNDNY